MSPIAIIDAVAMAAIRAIPDAVRADLIEADRALADATPRHLIDGMRGAATVLADRSYLAIYDHFTAGRIDDSFAMSEHFNEVLLSFADRMHVTLCLMAGVPGEWPSQCSTAIAHAFTNRIAQLQANGTRGAA